MKSCKWIYIIKLIYIYLKYLIDINSYYLTTSSTPQMASCENISDSTCVKTQGHSNVQAIKPPTLVRSWTRFQIGEKLDASAKNAGEDSVIVELDEDSDDNTIYQEEVIGDTCNIRDEKTDELYEEWEIEQAQYYRDQQDLAYIMD